MPKHYKHLESDSDEEQSGSDHDSNSNSDSQSNSDVNSSSKGGSDSGSGSDSDGSKSSGSKSGGSKSGGSKSGGSKSGGSKSGEQSEGDGSNSDSDRQQSSSEEEDQVQNDSRRSSTNSKSSSYSEKSRKVSLKESWEQNPDIYGIRRSGRERRQPDRISIEKRERTQKRERMQKRTTQTSNQWHSSDDSHSDMSSSDSEGYTKRKVPPRRHPAVSRRKARTHYDSDESSDDEKITRIARGTGGKVSYKETSEEEDEADLVSVDWNQPKGEEEASQTIDKVITQRCGKKGAVGMQTYVYEVEKKGDPNTAFDKQDPAQVEIQYLIKWKGWAHIHNTWESEESLTTQKFNAFQVKGVKKLENFQRREVDMKAWKGVATPEEVDYYEIQTEMELELNYSHLGAERIFAEVLENEETYYYIKWQNLPYSEATWELEDFVKEMFPEQLEAFKVREQSSCYPKQCPVLKHRPKFSPLKSQPDYVGGSNEELELRDYQLEGVNWLIHAWCKHNSVILADEMGLGKTIQTISFLSYLFHHHHLYGPFLIVLPLSTINAWQREFAQWAPDINVIVYIGDPDSRNIIHQYEWVYNSSKRIKFNCVLTTYEILSRDKELLRDSCLWSCLMIDEAHRLKNEDSLLYHVLQDFKTNHRLLITGTPLQNSLKELWALLHFIMPDKFDDWEYFEAQHDGENIKNGIHRLHKQLEPYLLRRVKKDVEKSLPAKVEKILRVDMTQLQKQYYKWILTKNYDMLRKGARGSKSSFVNIVMELKKCCNHATLIRPSELVLPEERLQSLLRGSGKLLLLDKLLVRLKETDHRVLIFSQMVRLLDILAFYLQLRRFTFQRLDGSVSGELRRQALDHFNAEGSSDFCFLLSTRAGGLGINLATADTVIIFDSDWNPQNDLQAQARAHRIGQKKKVNIYRFVTKNSIEETIIERAKKKMVLDHLVIQSMDTSGRTVFHKSGETPFNKEDLNAILKFGAEELFKDDSENEEEPVCDIDEILKRAETRDEGPSSAGDDLLSAFKVASFNLDEEESTRMDTASGEKKEWDEIIPEGIRSQMAEEKKQQEEAELYLAPRKRKALDQDEKDLYESPVKRSKRRSDSSDGESDEDRPRKRGRPRMHPKESVKGFADVEVRRFVKSFKRFSNPLRRLDTIANDADLRDKTLDDLKRLGETIIERCKESLREYDSQKTPEKLPETANGTTKLRRDRGPSFKLSGVAINAKTLLSTLEELDPLDHVVPHPPVERASWTLQLKKVKDAHWDIPWGIHEDSRLLRGIYEFGMGSWELLKGDPSLNLGEKILLGNNLKPQAKHLEIRAQYLFKLLKKSVSLNVTKHKRAPRIKAKKIKEPKGISKEIIENDSSTDDEATRTSLLSATSKMSLKEPVKEEKDNHKDIKAKVKEPKDEVVKVKKEENVAEEKEKKKKKKKDKKEHSGPIHITANGEPTPVTGDHELDQNHPLWSECKQKMRPMKDALKMLGNLNNNFSEEQLVYTRKCLLDVGDHIEKVLQQYEQNNSHKEWKHYLWQFVSKFTEYNAKALHKSYRKHRKMQEEENKKEAPADKEPKKEKHKSKEEKESRREKRKHDKEHHKSNKKPHNGWSSESKHREGDAAPVDQDKSHERKRNRERDRERGRDRNTEGNYSRDHWNYKSPATREYPKESRYPQDFKRENTGGGYNREGNYPHHGYNRGPGEWRGQRPHHSKPMYSPPVNYPPAHYPSHGMYGQGGRMGQGGRPQYNNNPHWGGNKMKPDRQDHSSAEWQPMRDNRGDRPPQSFQT